MTAQAAQANLANSDRYTETFDARGDLYNAAALINPNARDIERRLLIELMDVRAEHVVCDVPAGGGYLADGLRGQVHDTKKIFCVEPSQKFSEPISTDYTLYNCTISNIPVDDNSFDRIGSLAGLHHIDNKLPFFREAARLLKPNGLIGIGDVLVGSAVAKFLNGPVDRYTMSGHKGIFIRRGDYFQWFKNSGLEPKLEKYHEFHWSFDSLDQMVDYCKSLFGLVNANRSQVREALHSHFDIRHHGDKVLLPWSIIYGVGKKVA